MPNELAIPYLEKEAVLAAMMQESQYNAALRVSPLFQRVGYDAERIEIRVRERMARQLVHTTMDGEGTPIRSGDLKVREYSPSFIKAFVTLGAKEVAAFRRVEETAAMRDTPRGQGALERANEIIRDIGRDLQSDMGAERERLCVDAIQTGQITTKLAGGGEESIDYNLSALTAPSTKWDNTGATIIKNFHEAIAEFKTNNPRKLSPNVVFYEPQLYREAFLNNTEFQTWKKQNPDLARGFIRLAGGRVEADMEGYFIDPLFGLEWRPVDGEYLNLSGVETKFWNYKNLTLARVDRSGWEWGMTYGHEYNPGPDVNIEIEEPTRLDVKVRKVHAYDNGLPVIKDPTLVQTWRVIT